MRLPSMTMASLRAEGLPEPSIKVPLRITRVFLAALIRLLPRNLLFDQVYTAAGPEKTRLNRARLIHKRRQFRRPDRCGRYERAPRRRCRGGVRRASARL